MRARRVKGSEGDGKPNEGDCSGETEQRPAAIGEHGGDDVRRVDCDQREKVQGISVRR